jgi:putative PIG3 family NAD(P)H quinone oxidoreductase
MKAIQIVGKGAEARLELGEAPEPFPGSDEVLVDIVATAVNRADLLQRSGLYPPPAGASEVLGLECSGTVSAVGGDVEDWAVGDRVCALLPGGGYSERAVAHAGSLIAVPDDMPLVEAAAVPEVFLTCSLNLFQLGCVEEGDRVLVHGGGSGIGTAAIQLLRHAGALSIVTAGSADKCERCTDLGADLAINYNEQDFAEVVLEATGGEGVDMVLDSIGAPYFDAHMRCLSMEGVMVLIGLMGGGRGEVDLGLLLRKRITLIGSTLRARLPEEKAAIVGYFVDRFGTALEAGSIGPIVDRVLPLDQAQEAQEVLEESTHFGKVVLQVASEPPV